MFESVEKADEEYVKCAVILGNKIVGIELAEAEIKDMKKRMFEIYKWLKDQPVKKPENLTKPDPS